MNNDKCHQLISGNKNEHGNDNRLWPKIEKHLSELCKKANRKTNALSRLGKYLDMVSPHPPILRWDLEVLALILKKGSW